MTRNSRLQTAALREKDSLGYSSAFGPRVFFTSELRTSTFGGEDGGDPSQGFGVAVRRMQDSELAEERSARELRHATSEVKSALGQILEESQLQEAQLEEETLEAEAEICREEAQQLARLELQWQQAEHRAEAAALRYQEAAESEAASQQQYQQELEELKQRGDKKESKIRRQRLAAEEALAQAMTWCDQQSQLSLRLLRGDAPELTQDSDRCSQITDT
ncbi:unnamed protein product [Effrenium voratum]|nr:unnamed protein product [Effrenium voratum]